MSTQDKNQPQPSVADRLAALGEDEGAALLHLGDMAWAFAPTGAHRHLHLAARGYAWQRDLAARLVSQAAQQVLIDQAVATAEVKWAAAEQDRLTAFALADRQNRRIEQASALQDLENRQQAEREAWAVEYADVQPAEPDNWAADLPDTVIEDHATTAAQQALHAAILGNGRATYVDGDGVAR